MSEYIISGGKSLNGKVRVSGAKNAVLPILCASLLCSENTVTLTNCPDITDVTYTLEILKGFGCEVSFESGQITIDSQNAHFYNIPYKLTGKLRSTTLFLGAALSRFGKAHQHLSGGCNLGVRPIDMHLGAFEKMGVSVECADSLLCNGSPHSADIFLPFASVGATENIILAACLGSGITTITNAAKEPEVCELCKFINACGGKISGFGSSVIIIEGVEKLRGINYNIIGDRIEAATFLALALATDGEITVCGLNPDHLGAFTDVLVNSGGYVCKRTDAITVSRGGHFLLSAGRVETGPYPAFPTDAQSLLMSMLLKSHGETTIVENVFENRLTLANQLLKMGADITVLGNTATVKGVKVLNGAVLLSSDLRSGAALTVAALSAEGKSVVRGISHIERGYSNFLSKLSCLGADIIKTSEGEICKRIMIH